MSAEQLTTRPVVQLEQVHRTYRMGDIEVRALRGVSLSVEAGEMVAVMGPSGSGKSTLMNIIGCLDRPTRGSYVLEGRDVSTLSRDELASVRNSKIGFIFQSLNLVARTSAIDNVSLPLVYAGVPPAEQVRRAREALAEPRHPVGGRAPPAGGVFRAVACRCGYILSSRTGLAYCHRLRRHHHARAGFREVAAAPHVILLGRSRGGMLICLPCLICPPLHRNLPSRPPQPWLTS